MIESTAVTFLERLAGATSDHRLDDLVACFTEDYRNETPAHPARSFTGSARVRENWRQFFEFVPDISATVTCRAFAGPVVWSEWEMTGTRLDGTRHLMRGVIVFGLRGVQAEWARLSLEPVDADEADIERTVRRQVHADEAS